MRLPQKLAEGIAELSGRVPQPQLRRAAEQLSQDYRSDAPAGALRSGAERLAYLAVRVPATYAAVRKALEETAASIPGFAPASALDLGSGPGTALWALCEIFPSLRHLEALECDAGLASVGRELCQLSSNEALRGAAWTQADLHSWTPRRKYDLVIASYSLGELSAAERRRVAAAAWNGCEGALVVVEPGTRRGFDGVAELRAGLVAAGAALAAPCPHARECPMAAAGDWCHFAARVERSAEHRRLKQGELGHEDEKFSYMVATKRPVNAAGSRIVRHPMRYSGYTRLKLCSPEGLKEETVTRSQKERYREVKRSDWGSRWP